MAPSLRQTLHCGSHVRFLPPFFYGGLRTVRFQHPLGALGEREREREREREIDGSDVTIVALKLAMSFALFHAKNLHLKIGEEFCTFPCQNFTPRFLPS